MSNVAVATGPATVSVLGTQATVTATALGLVVVSYSVTSGGLVDYRRLVILVR